jgi:RNA polymerase sigma factor (sigma-70 family)
MLQIKEYTAANNTFVKGSGLLPHKHYKGIVKAVKETASLELPDQLSSFSAPDYYNSSSDELVRAFFRVAYRYPLLDAEAEIDLARRVRLLILVEEQRDRLIQELGQLPEQAELAQALAISETELEQWCAQGRAAKHTMMCSNLRLVFWVAKKYFKREMPFPDLIQEGVLGLNRAVEKFDPEKGCKFSTYAYWWIRQGITQSIMNGWRTIRLPKSTITKLSKLKQASHDLREKLGRKPTEIELAAEIDLSQQKLWLLRQMYYRSISLNYLVGSGENTELGDLLEDTSQSPEKKTVQTMMSQEVQKILNDALTRREREIIVLLYGLACSETHTLDEVSTMFNLSPERVRQIESRAMSKLRQPRVAKRLKSWLEEL